jgi:hypothetical protein
MPTQVQFRRGTTAENLAFAGAPGEITVDTSINTVRVHNGATAGGFELASCVAAQTLTNKVLQSPLMQTPSVTGDGMNFQGSTSGVMRLKAQAITATGTIFLPSSGGTLLTTGGIGSITGSMIANDTITDANISVSAAISSSKLSFDADVLPDADNTINLGSPSLRFANIYTGDLHLRNDRGDWTVVEEEHALTLRNNKTGKRYEFVLKEIED